MSHRKSRLFFGSLLFIISSSQIAKPLAFKTYLHLRWHAYVNSLILLIRHRGAWLLLPILPYFYLLSKNADPAVPWLPYFSVSPAIWLLPIYTLFFWICALPAISFLRSPELVILFASIPLSLRQHRMADAILACTACFPLPCIFFATALASWLRGGMISRHALLHIGALTLASGFLASSLIWVAVQYRNSSRPKRYLPPLTQLPIFLALPLNITFALLPSLQRYLLYGIGLATLVFLISTSWRFSSHLTMLTITVLQFSTRTWQLKLQEAQSLLEQELIHWPLTNIRLGVSLLSFSPYILFHAVFSLTILLTQPINIIPLFWLLSISFFHCLLLNRLHHFSRETSIFLQGFNWVLCLALISELPL